MEPLHKSHKEGVDGVPKGTNGHALLPPISFNSGKQSLSAEEFSGAGNWRDGGGFAGTPGLLLQKLSGSQGPSMSVQHDTARNAPHSTSAGPSE